MEFRKFWARDRQPLQTGLKRTSLHQAMSVDVQNEELGKPFWWIAVTRNKTEQNGKTQHIGKAYTSF
jgi:hypothetical protein